MSTSARKVDIFLKKFLSQQQITENFFDYLQKLIGENLYWTFRASGVFTPDVNFTPILSSSAPDTIDFVSPLVGTDGLLGHIASLDPLQGSLVPFENSLGIVYHTGLRFQFAPQETEINVRTGKIKYTFVEESIGELADPNLVVDDLDGTLTVRVDSVCEAGVSNAGRKVRIWLKEAVSQAQAFQELTVLWNGSNNYIETTHALGQQIGAVSVDATKYSVMLIGPTIKRNTDLRLDANVIYTGNVTGAGAGNTPATFDHTDVNNLAISIGSLSSLFFAEHSNIDGTHTDTTPETITTKQSVPGVQLDTRVNASDEDVPDAPTAFTLVPSVGGTGIQGVKWRLRNAAGATIALIDAHGNAYFQNLEAVTSVFQSSIIVEGNSIFGDDINTDVTTFNSVLASLSDLKLLVDSDNNSSGNMLSLYKNAVSALNEFFRVEESGDVKLFGNLYTANPGLNIDLDSDNNDTGEILQITKNGGLVTLLQLLEDGKLKLTNNLVTDLAALALDLDAANALTGEMFSFTKNNGAAILWRILETGVMKLYGNVITDLPTMSIDLDNDNDSAGENFSITKNAGAITLWTLNEFGDAKSLRDTLTAAHAGYKYADTTVIPTNASLNETHDETIFRKLLKATPQNPASKIVSIAGSRITAADGSDFVLPIGNLVSVFSGGTVNFGTGVVTGGANFTPIDFTGQASQWAKYSVNLLKDNTLLVLPATGFGATKALAPNPPLAKGAVNTVVVAVQDDGSAGVGTIANIVESNFDRLPAAGGGGSGSGSASSLVTRFDDMLNTSSYELGTDSIFEEKTDTLVDDTGPTTATYDVANDLFLFGAGGEIVQSIDLIDFIEFNEALDIAEIDVVLFWDLLGIDANAIVEASRDAGLNWQAVTMEQMGNGVDSFRGNLLFAEEKVTQLTVDYPIVNGDGDSALNATTQQSIGQKLTLASDIDLAEISLWLTRVGAPVGDFRIKLVRDLAGVPSNTSGDLIAMVTLAASSVPLVMTKTTLAVAAEPATLVPAGDYHIVLEAQANYISGFVGGNAVQARRDLSAPPVPELQLFDGSVWATLVGSKLIFEVKEHVLSVATLQEYDVANANITTPLTSVAGGFPARSQELVVTAHEIIKRLTLYLNKAGSPVGTFTVSIVKDDAGSPSTDVADLVAQSEPQSIAALASGNIAPVIDMPDVALLAGTYHIVVTTDDAYKASWITVTTELNWRADSTPSGINPGDDFNGTIWSAATDARTFKLEGRLLDLRLRITSSAGSKKLLGFGVMYDRQFGAVEGAPVLHTETFDGLLNPTDEFTLPWTPNDFLKVYDTGTGAVFSYGDEDSFIIDGQKVVFPAGTFDEDRIYRLRFEQSDGGGRDHSDRNGNLLATNHLGSTDPSVDKSVAGRGPIVRAADGVLVELSVNSDYDLEIYALT